MINKLAVFKQNITPAKKQNRNIIFSFFFLFFEIIYQFFNSFYWKINSLSFSLSVTRNKKEK
jgi:hypothetical protein